MTARHTYSTLRRKPRVQLCLSLSLALLMTLTACGRTQSGGLNVSGSTSVAPFVEYVMSPDAQTELTNLGLIKATALR